MLADALRGVRGQGSGSREPIPEEVGDLNKDALKPPNSFFFSMPYAVVFLYLFGVRFDLFPLTPLLLVLTPDP